MSELSAKNQISSENLVEEEQEDSSIILSDDAKRSVVDSLSPMTMLVKQRYESAKRTRAPQEAIWSKAYRNFRGLPGSDGTFIDSEKSKAFIKITKTKVMAGYGQILDIIFSDEKLPIEISATPEPLGVADVVHVNLQDPVGQQEAPPDPFQQKEESLVGYGGDGNDLSPGETLADRAGAFFKRILPGAKFKEGQGQTPADLTLRPAEVSASKMNRRLHDQLIEGEANTAIRQSTFEMCLLGTGVLKGPFSYNKEFPRWAEDGAYIPVNEDIPKLEHVSVWDFYIDPDSRALKDADWAIQRRKLSRSQMLDLKGRVGVRDSAVDNCVDAGANYVEESFEHSLDDNNFSEGMNRWEVLDYWGNVDKKLLEDLDVKLPIPEGKDEVQVNIWVCEDQLIKVIVNPFTPKRLPYLVCPFEFNPYNPWGVGIPENMEDTQALMNGFIRLAVDNAVISGSLMMEVDDALMVPGQNYKVKAGKFFHKNSGTGQRAIETIKVANTAPQNIQMFDTARRLADEATGIPSFSHGMTGVQGVGRTAGGISMLLNAASLSTKTVIKNADDFWFAPIGKHFYAWNMQFKFDKDLLGDLSIHAKGTINLMMKEVKTQKLTQLAMGVSQTPGAAWINWKEWTSEYSTSLGLGNRLLNNPEQAQLQAMLIQMTQQGQAPKGMDGQAMQGGGPALPGQEGFTGTPQEQGGQPPPQGQEQF